MPCCWDTPRPYKGHAGGMWLRCSLFWNHARPPILTAGSETETKQGITFTFTAEKACSHSWLEASYSKPFPCNHLFSLSWNALNPQWIFFLLLSTNIQMIWLECKQTGGRSSSKHAKHAKGGMMTQEKSNRCSINPNRNSTTYHYLM